MTRAYRAYSPSRGQSRGLTDNEQIARGIAGTLNQAALAQHVPHRTDWTVQAGTVTWEEAP